MLQEFADYRADLIEKRRQANLILGDGFWYYVFNNDGIAIHDLIRYLKVNESNPVLHAIPENHRAGLK